jgi:hypothetical protein
LVTDLAMDMIEIAQCLIDMKDNSMQVMEIMNVDDDIDRSSPLKLRKCTQGKHT